jgi:hypothetical protein
MSLEIYKLYNNQEKAISKFEIVHEGVFGNIRIEPYLLKNNSNDFTYTNVIVSIEDLTTDNNEDFVFKIIKSETQPDEELWNTANNTFTVPLINKLNQPESTQFKFWVRTYVQANTAPGLYSDKLKLKLSYEMSA